MTGFMTNVSALCLAICLGGGNLWGGGCLQEEPTEASALLQLRAQLVQAQNEQARQKATIELLTSEAAAAQQASRLAEVQASEMYRAAQAQLEMARARVSELEQQSKQQPEQNAEAPKVQALADLMLAQTRQATLLQHLVHAQADKDQAQKIYRQLQDEQANAALQGYALNRWSLLHSDAEPTQDYWIGVQCEPATDVQLWLESSDDRLVKIEGGLRVIAVTDDSPAQSAGVIEQDVILYMNDRPTNQIEELVAVIDENGEKEAVVVVVRDHRPLELTITPMTRPKTENIRADAAWQVAPEIYQDTVRVQANISGAEAVLPEGFEAEIHFSAGASPEFVIKSQADRWAVSSDAIESLPQEVRSFATHWWNQLQQNQTVQLRILNQYLPRYNAVPYANLPLLSYYLAPSNSATGEQTSELNAKLDQLQQQVNELRQLIEQQKE